MPIKSSRQAVGASETCQAPLSQNEITMLLHLENARRPHLSAASVESGRGDGGGAAGIRKKKDNEEILCVFLRGMPRNGDQLIHVPPGPPLSAV